ncbi:hypothetical protein [Azospirillum sp. Sp 7]|uniref:hypothetical protein n=1 Tax=Azospirillum sp. Sp 7 TaxID=1685931 RepID=UPI001FFF3532|nr:hypothetical protein [Azospirillum sp. Sp 7]
MTTVPSPSPAPDSAPTDRGAVPAATSGRREFPFERRHFDFIAHMLYQLAGIALAPHKIEMVYSRLPGGCATCA